jgi:AraC-like DNA-binding protein
MEKSTPTHSLALGLAFASACHLCARDWLEGVRIDYSPVWRCLRGLSEDVLITRDSRGIVAGAILSLATSVCPAARPAFDPRPCGGSSNYLQILSIIATRYSDQSLRLKTLAPELGLSVVSISRMLTACTSGGFSLHLNGIRMLRAAVLLPVSESVKAVSYAVGFSRTSELDRQFRRWTRFSPVEFRDATRYAVTIPLSIPTSQPGLNEQRF